MIAAVSFTSSAQQGGGDPETMKQRMKERVKPLLIEKTKLSDLQADKVIDIQFEASKHKKEVRNDQSLGDPDKKKKVEAINADVAEKMKAIPLTEAEVKSVMDFYEEMRKNMQQKKEGN